MLFTNICSATMSSMVVEICTNSCPVLDGLFYYF